MTDAIPELAAEIAPTDSEEPSVVMRVGLVTAVEVGGERRVQVDAFDAAWINRVQDCSLAVGDRVSILQQGAVLLVVGRLSAGDALTPIGAVLPYAGASPPTGWLIADGTAVSRTTYATLFSVCGTTYGSGNGTTTFNLPNLANRAPVGVGTRGRGATAGSTTATLSTGNLPAHDHGGSGGHGHSMSGSADFVGDHSHSYGSAGSRSDLLASGGSGAATASGGSTGGGGGHSHSLSGSVGSVGDHTHGSVGSGTAFSIESPLIVMQYIIRVL